MRFRAKMTDGFCMRRFVVTMNTLSKLGKQCIVCLSEKDICFVILEEGGPKSPLAWCTLQQTQFFNEYNLIGLTKEQNTISLKFSPEMFAKTIASLKTPSLIKSLKIKLTKKKTPCLTCEIEMMTVQEHSMTCIHDVPVDVISQRFWKDLAAPKHLAFDLGIQMPNMKRLKTACDRMKILGTQVTIEGNKDGIFVLKTEKDLATVATYFKELEVENCSGADTDKFYSVKVDFKKLMGFLSIQALNPTKIFCYILDGKLLFMNVLHEKVMLKYYIPGIEN